MSAPNSVRLILGKSSPSRVRSKLTSPSNFDFSTDSTVFLVSHHKPAKNSLMAHLRISFKMCLNLVKVMKIVKIVSTTVKLVVVVVVVTPH